MLKRSFDLFFSIVLAIVLIMPLLMIAIVVRVTSPGPILYWSKRVGLGNKIFLMPKFRTMRIDTPQVATHLLTNPEHYLSSVGAMLRKLSLDEIPQLYSVFMGEMSFVGPRPALYNQDDLVALRTAKGVHLLKPGITGWAQINGRDDIAIPIKVDLDEYYLRHQSFAFDLKILFLTLIKVTSMQNIQH